MTKIATNQIPDGWEEKTLGEVLILHYGKSLSQTNRILGSVPVYGSSGITGWHNEPLTDSCGVIIGRKGTIGSVHKSDVPFFPIDTVYYLTEADTKCDFGFLYYFLTNFGLSEMNSDSAVPGLNRNNVYSRETLLPPRSEQNAIADVLSALDDKIELLRKQNKTLEAIAQAIFKVWFVNFNFPDKDGKPYKDNGGTMIDSELGEIPECWEVESLYDIAKYINGGAFKQADFSPNNSGLPVIKIVELKDGITNNTRYTENAVPEKILIDNKDVLFSWSGSPETSIDIFVWHLGKGVLNQHTFKVVAHQSIDESWVYNVLKYHKPLFINIAKQKQTTGLGHVTVEDLRQNKVARPKDDVLSQYDSLAKPLFDKYYLSLKEMNNLSKLRDTLLPRLMTGQVRVKGDTTA